MGKLPKSNSFWTSSWSGHGTLLRAAVCMYMYITCIYAIYTFIGCVRKISWESYHPARTTFLMYVPPCQAPYNSVVWESIEWYERVQGLTWGYKSVFWGILAFSDHDVSCTKYIMCCTMYIHVCTWYILYVHGTCMVQHCSVDMVILEGFECSIWLTMLG